MISDLQTIKDKVSADCRPGSQLSNHSETESSFVFDISDRLKEFDDSDDNGNT